VDYAHTPDALENVLKTAGPFRHKNGQLITVIGCGGDRDKGKRPIMAAIAQANSTSVILTSDNPRSENPSDILAEMREGLVPSVQIPVVCIEDREQAILTSSLLAKNPGDIVVIAGKGHESYQEINGVKYPFDDLKIAQKYFNPI
jgi:UDP-N-acetylmuramoyl-L-alanyl-D-glutamate--2,6-diaminopimelate ligase